MNVQKVHFLEVLMIPRWWQLKYLLFSPLFSGEMMGWSHQLDDIFGSALKPFSGNLNEELGWTPESSKSHGSNGFSVSGIPEEM